VRQAAADLSPPSVRQAAAHPPATTGVGAELASARARRSPGWTSAQRLLRSERGSPPSGSRRRRR
jgi:hypothetical protein